MLTCISNLFKRAIINEYKKDFNCPCNTYTFDFQKKEILLMSSPSIKRKIRGMKKAIKNRQSKMAKKLAKFAYHEWLNEQVEELITFAYTELSKRSELHTYDSLGLRVTND